MSVSDSAELAALAVEFVHSLDNVPHQVSHMLKEIEHKDAKCQELLPKVADRELQYRKLINTLPPGPWTGLGTSTAQQGVAETLERADKLAERINLDYSRLDEWAVQKAALSEKLWSILFAHHTRLRAELARVDPKVLANVPVPPPTPGLQPPLLAALGNFVSAAGGASAGTSAAGARPGTPASAMGSAAAAVAAASAAASTSTPTAGSGSAGADAATTPSSSAAPPKPGPGRRTAAGGSGAAGRSSGGAHGPSPSASRGDGADSGSGGRAARQVDADGDTDLQEKGEGEEKDETPYCYCRQVSFGEMIGCDSDTCKIEWFHVGCVGVSKPLPATWYCEDCLKQMSSTTQKKRKRQG